jgi:hypothetical protein
VSRAALGGEVPDAGTEPTRRRGDGVDDVGALVVDADDPSDDPDVAVVVNRPPVACEDWTAYFDAGAGEEVSVAADNPAYDPDAEVVVVAFRADLERARPEYGGDRPLPLAEVGPKTYAFPPRRLQRVGHLSEDDADGAPSGTSDPSDRLTDAQRDLRERLAETSDVEVAADPDDPEAAVLVVEKLGAEHTIDADGAVEGGPLADRLGDIADEYLGGDSA